MEALWSRFIPSYNKVRDDIKNGVIGDVLHSEVTFGVKTDHVERVLKKELGGGNALDTGIYTANWSQFVHGSQKPKRVCFFRYACCINDLLLIFDNFSKIVANGHLFPSGTDSSFGAVITYENGGIATLATNSHARFDAATAQVHGTKGSITLHFPFWDVVTIIFLSC